MVQSETVKSMNQYAEQFGQQYAKIPKSVFAAVAFSFASSGGDHMGEGVKRFTDEWKILFENGIVQQKPRA